MLGGFAVEKTSRHQVVRRVREHR